MIELTILCIQVQAKCQVIVIIGLAHWGSTHSGLKAHCTL